MENCLVTKLKSAVSDPNNELLKVGELRFKILNADVYDTELYSSVAQTISLVNNNGVFKRSSGNIGTTMSINNTTYGFGVSVAAGEISVPNKYVLNCINGGHLFKTNINDLSFCSNLTDVIGRISGNLEKIKDIEGLHISTIDVPEDTEDELYGNIDVLTKCNILTLRYYSHVTGTLSAFANNTSFTRLILEFTPLITPNINYLANCSNISRIDISHVGNCSGSVNNLGKLVNMTSFRLNGTGVSGLEGSLEGMLEAMWANNRRSGTLNIANFNSNIKFNNNNLGSYVATFNSDNIVVTSDGTTVGIYNGTNWTY